MRHWPLWLYGLVYALAFLALTLVEGVSPVEPLFVLVTFGFGMSGLAWWATRGLTPRSAPVRAPNPEARAALGYLLGLALFITWGLPVLRSNLPVGWPAEFGILVAKSAIFIGVPYLIWRQRFGYPPRELFDLRSGLVGHWRPTLIMGSAVIAFQAFFGRAHRELPALHPAPLTLGLAAAASLLWLLLDVGLVEEVPFRGLFQTRWAAATNSELAGLVTMAVAFGLAHAPGLFLRPEMMGEPVGAHPSLLHAISYSLVITSVASFLYGVLWLRTRNLWVLAVVHACQDWLPALADALRDGYLGA